MPRAFPGGGWGPDTMSAHSELKVRVGTEWDEKMRGHVCRACGEPHHSFTEYHELDDCLSAMRQRIEALEDRLNALGAAAQSGTGER